EELWTTSQEVLTDSGSQIIQLQGAASQSLCTCVSGSFLWFGRCWPCPRGTLCPGSNQLDLRPGYFSSPEEPAEVYICEENVCPGGPPGSCAENRDVESVACSMCLSGYHPRRDGSCHMCHNSDYLLLLSVLFLAFLGVAALYISLLKEAKAKQSRHVLVVVFGLSQFLVWLQMLSCIRRFNIDWADPLKGFLLVSEVLSLNVEVVSFACLTRSPVETFLLRALFMPGLALIASAVFGAHKAGAQVLVALVGFDLRQLDLRHLLRTIGSLFLLLFIILFTMLLAPFRCKEHPNGRFTVQGYPSVHCDGQGEHLQMFIIGGLACLMPISFLAVCVWLVTVELPRRMLQSDACFVRACSFLIIRFRPGAELFAVVLLLRNTLVALCPMLAAQSTQLLTMSLVLYVNLLLVALLRPWRFAVCNSSDMTILLGILVILDMGAVTVQDRDRTATAQIVMVFISLMFLASLATLCLGMSRCLAQKFRKRFKFFLCHHKRDAGAMARLLKMELERRLHGTRAFIDCDDLSDLTQLFSYVAQDTESFVILGTKEVFLRKWCIGEMVTARASGVRSLLLEWPDWRPPSETFIESVDSVVPDIHELVRFGIGLADVQDTFRQLSSVKKVRLPGQLNPANIAEMVDSVVGVGPVKGPRSSSRGGTSEFPLLVDPDNLEAVASALVLSTLLKPLLLGTQVPVPSVLLKGSRVAVSTKMSLMLCSENCFRSEHVQEWLLQAYQAPSCCMIPVLAEDSFRVPAASSVSAEFPESGLDIEDLHLYGVIIRVLFQDIAVIFLPQSFSREDLDLRAQQAARRLSAPQETLQSKVIRFMDSADAPTAKRWTEVPLTAEDNDTS
ncbi:unnamed protein product, partial [Symbiodinium sp. KB8]